ncbi:MAG: GTP cyclohydrolase II [Deltaproteobacteria bacterium]|nr:GTP cyclohydrolase II [Deltaproteobacteria bacterium]
MVEILARTPLPTRHGLFECIAFRRGPRPGSLKAPEPEDPCEVNLAMVVGDPEGAEELLCRVHSACFTGEVLHSLKCDCRSQLDAALAAVAGEGRGMVIYLRQEGRGIGLVDKLRAYALQEDEGLDTVDANRALGLPDDTRRYDSAAELLGHLGVKSIRLLTNNPSKVEGLSAAGVKVVRREALVVPQSEEARAYLDTKVARMGHLPD